MRSDLSLWPQGQRWQSRKGLASRRVGNGQGRCPCRGEAFDPPRMADPAVSTRRARRVAQASRCPAVAACTDEWGPRIEDVILSYVRSSPFMTRFWPNSGTRRISLCPLGGLFHSACRLTDETPAPIFKSANGKTRNGWFSALGHNDRSWNWSETLGVVYTCPPRRFSKDASGILQCYPSILQGDGSAG